MDFVERRIQQAQRAGLFEDLGLEGRPIPDLDQERAEGWWAASFASRDEALQLLHKLVAELPQRKGRAMVGDDHDAVRRNLVELQLELDKANEAVDPDYRAVAIDIEDELRRWRARRRQQKWGRYLDDAGPT